jgi:hypothetical protein
MYSVIQVTCLRQDLPAIVGRLGGKCHRNSAIDCLPRRSPKGEDGACTKENAVIRTDPLIQNIERRGVFGYTE